MQKLAAALNQVLENTPVYSMLSDYGRRMYVPKGIIVQSAEAKQKANRYNATIGIALQNGTAMHIPAMKAQFAPSMKSGEIFPYAPMGGVPALRQKWLEEMRLKNPDLKDAVLSLPVVCCGLTNALSLVFSLFVEKDDPVVLPSMYWENYDLIITEQRQAKKVFFDNYNDKGGFNVEGLDRAVSSVQGDKVIIILNFPNNPTGYTPTFEEADEIAAVIRKHAEKGKKVIFVSDDAYFGLFFEKDTNTQSLFAKLAGAHENILAVKCDAATKEEMVWGFRVAFITYASKGLSPEALDALVQKTMGAVRGTLSNCSMSAQQILLKGMNDESYRKDKAAGIAVIGKRYEIMKRELEKHKGSRSLTPYPFNSGYFMSFKTTCNAEDLRQKLLNDYGTGSICLGEHLLRLAFSSVDDENIPGLIDVVYKAADELV